MIGGFHFWDPCGGLGEDPSIRRSMPPKLRACQDSGSEQGDERQSPAV